MGQNFRGVFDLIGRRLRPPGRGQRPRIRRTSCPNAATASPCACRMPRWRSCASSSSWSRAPCPPSRLDELPRGPPDAGVLRQRAAAISASATCSTRSPPTRRRRGRSPTDQRTVEPGEDKVIGLRVQGPGQHGPQAPRPRGVHAAVLGPLPARHAAQHGPRTASRSPCTTRSSSSPTSARSPRRPGPATSSACPTTASSGSATR